MGGSESKNSEIDNFERKFDKLKTYEDTRYGEITIYCQKTNKKRLIMVKKIWTFDQIDTNINILSTINRTNEHLFDFLGHFKNIEKNFCTTHTRHFIALEFPILTLKQKLTNFTKKNSTKKYKKYIPESKIWFIFHSTVKALMKLKAMSSGYFNSLIQQQAFQVHHGDIQPKTIHFTAEGEIKLLVPSLIGSLTGYEKMLHSSGIMDISKKSKNSKDPKFYKACLSPLLTEALKNGVTSPRHDPFASDVWSLGMTVLSACSLKDYTQYYDYDQGLIKYADIQKDYLKMLKLGYSEELVKCIESCLQETEERRAVLQGLDKYIEGLRSVGSQKENNPLNANLSLRNRARQPKIDTDSLLSGIQLKIKSGSKREIPLGSNNNPVRAMRLGDDLRKRNVFHCNLNHTPVQRDKRDRPKIGGKSKKRSLSLSSHRSQKATFNQPSTTVSNFNPYAGGQKSRNLSLKSSSGKKQSRSIDHYSFKASNLKSKWDKKQDSKPMFISNFMVKQNTNVYKNRKKTNKNSNPLFTFNFKNH